MAANFGAGSTAVGEMATSASPRAGIVDNPVFIEAVGTVTSKVGDLLRERKEQNNQTALSQFTKQQLLVADSVAQGKRSSAFAQTVLRQNLIQAIDANPMLAQDFVKAQSSIMGLAGGGRVAAEGTKEEQRRLAREDQLITAGLVKAGASESEFNKADEAARIAVAASERHKQRMATLAAEKASADLTSTRRAEIVALEKEETNRLVAASAPAELISMKSKFQNILDSDLSEADKIIAIKEYKTAWEAETIATLGNVDSAVRDMLQSTFSRVEEEYLAQASGEIGDAELTRRLAREEKTMEALLKSSNPEIARLAVLSKVVGPEAITQLIVRNGNNAAMETFMKFVAGADPTNNIEQPSFYTDERDTKDAATQFLKELDEGLSSSDPQRVQEATIAAQSLMQSIEDDAGRITRDPKKAITLINHLASPSFLKARRANPEAFSNIDGAAEVLKTNYHDEVSGMIETEFKKAKVFVRSKTPTRGGLVSTPTTEIVQAVGTEGGMTFQPIDTDNPQARREAARLNKELKPIINNSLKAMAHLNGNSNYQELWEAQSDAILGLGGDTELAGGDAGDDLTTEDFIEPVAKVQPIKTEKLPTPVQEDREFLGEVDRVASKYGTTPADLLAVMDFETGGSFSPSQKNAAGSSGTGLIQFMAATAKELGTSTKALSQMSRVDQMQYVDKYFSTKLKGVKNPSVQDLYMAVLWPKAAGKSDDYVLWRRGSKQYGPNSGLDLNGDGTITKREAAAKVVSFVDKYKA